MGTWTTRTGAAARRAGGDRHRPASGRVGKSNREDLTDKAFIDDSEHPREPVGASTAPATGAGETTMEGDRVPGVSTCRSRIRELQDRNDRGSSRVRLQVRASPRLVVATLRGRCRHGGAGRLYSLAQGPRLGRPASDLRAAARERTKYMMPAFRKCLDAIPVTRGQGRPKRRCAAGTAGRTAPRREVVAPPRNRADHGTRAAASLGGTTPVSATPTFSRSGAPVAGVNQVLRHAAQQYGLHASRYQGDVPEPDDRKDIANELLGGQAGRKEQATGDK